MRGPENKSCNGMSRCVWEGGVEGVGRVSLFDSKLLVNFEMETVPEGGKYYEGGAVNWSLKT